MIFHFCQGIETKSSINVYMSIESVWRNLQDILLMISFESDWEQQYITICSFLTSTMQNFINPTYNSNTRISCLLCSHSHQLHHRHYKSHFNSPRIYHLCFESSSSHPKMVALSEMNASN